MATVKVKFRASSRPAGEGRLFFRVIHERAVRQVAAGYGLYSGEWDAAVSDVVVPPGAGSERRRYLASLRETLQRDGERLRNLVGRLERSGERYTAESVVRLFRASSGIGGFVAFARDEVRMLERIGKFRTAERYVTVLNSFGRFLGERELLWDEVVPGLMVRYENYLKSRGVCPNTSSYYMRGLRAIYNRAVDRGLTVQRAPFSRVYTGIGRTCKRAVPLAVIRRIRDMDLSHSPSADLARDLFMFSFYTRGMSFIDMAYLKKSDLRYGRLSYRRQKTGRQLDIGWERPMQEIVDKYDTSGTPYLLPIIRDPHADARRQYKNAAHLVNGKLRRLGEELGLAAPLTTYVARHGWASIARSRNIPLSTISEAMGHDSEKTTRIYLASLDTSAVDRANRQIIDAL